MSQSKWYLLLTIWLFASLVGICFPGNHYSFAVEAGEQSIRHEVSSGFSWRSENLTYDDYVTNGEPRPDKSETYEKAPWEFTGSYTLYFKPIPHNPDIPFALQQFYAHPSALHAAFALQPDASATNRHHDPVLQYERVTEIDEHSQSGEVGGEYYFLWNTGVILRLRSTKSEEELQLRETLPMLQGTGQNTEIQDSYTAGLSQYIGAHARIYAIYTRLDGEYHSQTRTWLEDRPLLFTDHFEEYVTDGKQLSFSGEYVFSTVVSLRGEYARWDQQASTDVWSVYSNNFPSDDFSAQSDTTGQLWGTIFNLYFGTKASVQIEGSYAIQHIQQTYTTPELGPLDQVSEYDWARIAFSTELYYALNRHIGIYIGYEHARQTGDILIWYTNTTSRTTNDTDLNMHAVYSGIRGRF